jgi:hypothetical protein
MLLPMQTYFARLLSRSLFGLALSVDSLASAEDLTEGVVCMKDWGKADELHGEVRFGYHLQQHEAQSPYKPLIVKAVQGRAPLQLP